MAHIYLKESLVGREDKMFPDIRDSAVYLMYNIEDRIIYVGRSCSGNLSKRISSHRNTSQFFKEVGYIKVILFDNVADCCIYELYYISKYLPAYNKDKPEKSSTLNLPHFKQEVYYTHKPVVWNFTESEDISLLYPKTKLKRYVGETFKTLTIRSIILSGGVYLAETSCTRCGCSRTISLSSVIKSKFKTCVCSEKKVKTYAEQDKDLSEIYGFSNEDLKSWRCKYKLLRGQYKRVMKKELTISFVNFVKGVATFGVEKIAPP